MGGQAFVLAYPEARLAVGLATNLSFAELGEKEALTVAARFREPARAEPK